MANKVFENTLSNGVTYEIHEAEGFGGHSEMAVIIGGQILGVIEFDQLRTKNCIVKPRNFKTIRVSEDGKVEDDSAEEEQRGPTLDDVSPQRISQEDESET